MCKIIVLWSFMLVTSFLPMPSQATSLTLGAEVIILANVLLLSQADAQKICAENADLKNCSIVIARHENDEVLESNSNFVDISELQHGEYPVRMINFE